MALLSMSGVYTQQNNSDDKAKVGINTEDSQTKLDINGYLSIREKADQSKNELYLNTFGSKDNKLVAGKKDWYVFSQGDQPAAWRYVNSYESDGVLYLSYINTKTDSKGTQLSLSGDKKEVIPNTNLPGAKSRVTYSKDTNISLPLSNNSAWVPIPDLEQVLEIKNQLNSVNITFSTGAQVLNEGKNPTLPEVDYACAIFIDDFLSAVRTDIAKGNNYSIQPLTVTENLSNLPPGKHTIKVACHVRNVPTIPNAAIYDGSYKLNLGKPFTQWGQNTEVLQSVPTTKLSEATK